MNLLRRNSKCLIQTKKSQNFIYKLRKQSFLHSHYYSSNEELKIEDYNNKNMKIFKPKQPILIEKGGYILLKNTSKHTRNIIWKKNILIPINAFIAFKFYRCVTNFRPIKSILYGLLLSIVSLYNYEINKKLYHLIVSIELLECGEKIRIILANKKKFVLEISKLRMISKKELEFLVNKEDNIFSYYYPIVANRKVYFISKDSDIIDETLFIAIMKGNKISIDKKINKENILNI